MSPPTDKKTKSSTYVEETFRAYDRELHGFLLRRLRNHEQLTEDVRQEIYLRILRFTDAEFVREPRAYLYRIARNVLHDKRLLQEREQATFDSSNNGIAEEQGSTEGPIEEQVGNARDLEHILSFLPPLYRAILLLRKRDGLSYMEIAEELNISVHTVKKYLRFALARCRSVEWQ